jgi:hypothetical protein
MSKRLVAAAGACVLVALVAVPLAAVGGSGGGAVNRQVFESRTTPKSISSSTFHAIPGMSPLTCSRGAVAVTVSLSVIGGPVGVRVLVDDGGAMQPGAVRVQPGSSSYTFVSNVGPFEASDGHAYDVQWRSPTGHEVTLQKGDVLVQYRDPGTCG